MNIPLVSGEKLAGSDYNYLDFLAIGLSKRTTESILSKISFVGNGTYKSAVIKSVGGVLLSEYSHGKGGMGKIANYVAAGLIIDGVEDLTVAVFGNGNPIDVLLGTASQSNASSMTII
jgi:hypothetical protein